RWGVRASWSLSMTLSKRIFSAILCVSAFALIAPDAHAGFDWTPPPRQKEEMHSLKATPEAPADAGPLTPDPDAVVPVPVENVQTQTLPTTQAIPPVEAQPAPVMEAPAPAETSPTPLSFEPLHKQLEEQPQAQPVPAPAPTPVAPVVNEAPQPAVLEGFGSDISLALALRDIVPSGYAYAFKNSSDAGLKVSWSGGKVWQDVLSDALAPHKLVFAIVDNAVYIYPVEEQAQSQSAPVPVMETPAPAETSADTSAAPVMDIKAPKEQVVPPIQIVEQPKKAVESPAVPVMNTTLTREWAARPGTTLRQTIEDWGKIASVETEWRSPYDYPIDNPFSFNGTFDKAVESILSQYSAEKQPPRGRLYTNLPTGPSVLMVY
ncbi:MAG TPA: TcpQ domain-containing protein, partial [Alphaproteobacteria bacterium]|nr:TcpQ domain-containing protein [Alphaproteobacteria bacterium]